MNVPSSDELIQTVTHSTFDERVLTGTGPVAVEFMSYGCDHCRTLEPVLQKVATRLQAKEQLFRVNVAIEPELAADYAIEGTPTLVMFLNGDEVGRAEGPRPTLESVLAAVTEPFQS